MAQKAKITTGANDRPRDETIAQTGGGLPDDTSASISVDDAEAERIKASLQGGSRPRQGGSAGPANPDAVSPGSPGSGENICRRCEGSGRIDDGRECPDCGGTGKITAPIGGA
jgi:hypothetical protein